MGSVTGDANEQNRRSDDSTAAVGAIASRDFREMEVTVRREPLQTEDVAGEG